MANALQICRICLSVNVKMFTFKNTNMENIYQLLTQICIDIDDAKPATVCFLCYARMQQCNRLQQQAIKSNELLDQLLRGSFMHATANAIMNNQYNSQNLQVSTMYHLDLEPITCEGIILDPNVEGNSLISVKEEHLVLDFSEDGYDPYGFFPETINSNSQEDKHLTAIGSNHCNGIKDLSQSWEQRKQNTAGGTYKKSEKKFGKTKRIPNKQKNQKPSHNEDAQENINCTQPSAINAMIGEFECNECGKVFKNKDNLTDHIFICMKTTETLVCNKQLTKPNTFKSSLSDMYSCDICTYKAFHKHVMKAHLKMHKITNAFTCNICEYRCAKKFHLKRHMIKHTGEKPLSCNICEYRCVQKNSLKLHMLRHMDKKPFSCNICEYTCVQKLHLKRHMKTHTGEKPFSCNICEYRSIQKHHLKTHMRTHTGEKPFSCHLCDYKSARKCGLKEHMSIHTGDKPFSCNNCDYRCARKERLKEHILRHTGKTVRMCTKKPSSIKHENT